MTSRKLQWPCQVCRSPTGIDYYRFDALLHHPGEGFGTWSIEPSYLYVHLCRKCFSERWIQAGLILSGRKGYKVTKGNGFATGSENYSMSNDFKLTADGPPKQLNRKPKRPEKKPLSLAQAAVQVDRLIRRHAPIPSTNFYSFRYVNTATNENCVVVTCLGWPRHLDRMDPICGRHTFPMEEVNGFYQHGKLPQLVDAGLTIIARGLWRAVGQEEAPDSELFVESGANEK